MIERLTSKRVLQGTAIMCGAVALSGCGSMLQARENLNGQTARRIDFDYGGGKTIGGGEWMLAQDCLKDTPYDPIDAAGGAAVTTYMHNGELVASVTPSKFNFVPHILKLVGFGNDRRPLQPYDETSRQILDSYGCDTSGKSDFGSEF